MIDAIDDKQSLARPHFNFSRLAINYFHQAYFQQRHQLNSGCNMLFHVLTLLNLVFQIKLL